MAENTFNNDPNEPVTTPPEETPQRPRSNRGLLYAILIIALAGTWGYLLWDKSQHNQKEQQLTAQIDSTASARTEIQQEFDAANARLDQLTSENTRMDSLVKSKDKDLSELRAKIRGILNNKNATQAELNEARTLISQLNSNIENYKEQIEKLQGEKIVITNQRDSIKRNYDTVTVQNQNLNQQVQLGSVLHASSIKITPINIKGSGKEVSTTRAKKADMMRVTFDLDENRIATTGPKDIYVCITAPDGTPLAVEALGSGKFTLADGTEKLYTAMKTVDYTMGQKSTVNIDWKQNSDFKPGTYKVEIYDAGYLIGHGDVQMKKGGFL